MRFLVVVLAASFGLTFGWSPNSWRSKDCSQLPKYKNTALLDIVTSTLSKKTPLVISEEIELLQSDLEEVQDGKKFLFMGGDCAETFREHSADNIILNYQLFILSALILMKHTSLPVVKIARMAGQFSKPRSDEFENVNGEFIKVYKGDMINRENPKFRDHDPKLMIKAYQQSAETLNLLRALSNSYFSNIDVNEWITSLNLYAIKPILDDFKQNLNILKACGLDKDRALNSASIYTGHEGLLLEYEQAFTRTDRFTGKYYDCSSHFLWIGERTRNIEEGHVEFFRGINNPIGVKLSTKIEPNELLCLLDVLNPTNKKGKISLIVRMGKKIYNHLPQLIDAVQEHRLNVIWVCDPMHANGSVFKNKKTRFFKDIIEELECFFQIHKEKGTLPGGIHLEMTGRDVTECIGGKYNTYFTDEIYSKYESSCDPRLNIFQTIELIEHVAPIINEFND